MMKIKQLLIFRNMKMFLCLFFLLFITDGVYACPVFLRGLVKVVDEKGLVLNDAVIWEVYSLTDSFRVSKKELYYLEDDTTVSDSSSFRFWSNYSWDWDFEDEDESFIPYYRVHVNGYADLIVKKFDFYSYRNREKSYQLPTIYVTMYHSMYVRKGEEYLKLAQFEMESAKAVADSTILVLSDYVQNLKQETQAEELIRKSVAKILSYPNPAANYLKVEIKDSMPLPYKAVICDMQGRPILEQLLTESVSSLDLINSSPGFYIITVYKYDGELQYCIRFTKV